MGTADLHDRVRAAFVGSGLVTPGQWDSAAGRTGSPAVEATLAALQSVPAAWADEPGLTAVTAYHAKLAAHLTRDGLTGDLPRRLRWGRFLILWELGRGGMGVVFLAWDTDARQLVALKRFQGSGRQVRSRFEREARLLARFEHPSIARFLGLERAGGADVLVMEYVPGMTASRAVRRRHKQGRVLPWETAVGWALQVLAALVHAHERRVVHRDIKPSNIMVTPGGRGVKLLDMGLAKCIDEPGGDALTQDGQALGTREYMPPEQWEGKPVTPAADLYALGCTLFFLLAGRPPYTGENGYRQMQQHLSAPIPSVREVRPDVPAGVDQVIQRMMAKNPAHRGTAREVNWLLARQAAAARQPAPVRVEPADSGAEESPSESVKSSHTAQSARSAHSGTRQGDTARAVRPTQTTLVGSGVWELATELASEVGRLVRGWFSRERSAEVTFVTNPARRVREVGGELAHALWDGLTGRRPDAARPAWLVLSAAVAAVAGLAWFL